MPHRGQAWQNAQTTEVSWFLLLPGHKELTRKWRGVQLSLLPPLPSLLRPGTLSVTRSTVETSLCLEE
jgi:hypothetical protein